MSNKIFSIHLLPHGRRIKAGSGRSLMESSMLPSHIISKAPVYFPATFKARVQLTSFSELR